MASYPLLPDDKHPRPWEIYKYKGHYHIRDALTNPLIKWIDVDDLDIAQHITESVNRLGAIMALNELKEEVEKL